METPPREFRYQAFISYRHAEADRRWAKWLHSALETYRIPKALRGNSPHRGIGRIFRDEEELPASANLSREIEIALADSRFLIVVCSPRTPESEWVNKEVVRFRELGRGDSILALLIEGEPSESFPRSLREIRRVSAQPAEVPNEADVERVDIEEVEPLAADVRSTRPESARYLRHMARLRILACLLGCSFDDLRQRDQERRLKTITTIGLSLAALCAVLMGVTLYALQQRSAALASQAMAVASQRQSQDRLVRQYNANGQRLLDAGRWMESLPWYVESLRENQERPGEAEIDRIRLGIVHSQLPQIERLWPHPASIRDAAISPDGGLIAVGCGNHQVLVWNLQSGVAHCPPLEHDDPVTKVVFSSNGRYLATVAGDRTGRRGPGSVRIWNAATGRIASPILRHQPRDDRPIPPEDPEASPGVVIPHTGVILDVDWDPESAQLITAGDDRTARLWRIPEGVQIGEPISRADNVISAKFNPDGRSIIVMTGKDVAVLDATTRKEIWPALEFGVLGRHAEFSNDGKRLLIVSSDKAVVCDVASGEQIAAFAEEGPIADAAFNAEATRVIVGRVGDDTARVWSIDEARWLTQPLPQPGLQRVGFLPDGLRAWSSGADVRVWRATTGDREVPPLAPALSLAIPHPDGLHLATIVRGNCVALWNLATSNPVLIRRRPGASSEEVVLSGNARRVAVSASLNVAGREGTVGRTRVFDVRSGTPLTIDWAEEFGVITAVFSPDDRRLATCSGDSYPYPPDALDHPGEAHVWDIAAGAPVTSPLAHPRTVRCAAFAPDGARLATGADDYRVRIWSTADGKLIAGPIDLAAPISALAFDHTGEKLLTAGGGSDPWSAKGQARVWNSTTAQPLSPPMNHPGIIDRAWWSADGAHIVARYRYMKGDTEHVRSQIWNESTGASVGEPVATSRSTEPIFAPDSHTVYLFDRIIDINLGQTMRGFTAPILAVSFAAKPAWLLTGDFRIRSGASGEPLTPPLSTNRPISVATFSPDGRILATAHAERSTQGSDSYGLQLWYAATGEALSPYLRVDAPIESLKFDAAGRQLVVVGHDYRSVFVWPLDVVADPRPIERWNSISSLLSAHDIDASGGYVEAEVKTAWNELSSTAMEGFRADDRLVVDFYRYQASLAAAAYDAVAEIWFLKQLAKVRPEQSDDFVYRGLAELRLKHWAAAIDDFSRAIESGATDATAWQGRGDAKVAIGDWQGALTDLERAVELGTTDDDALVSLAIAQAMTGDRIKANLALDLRFRHQQDHDVERCLGPHIVAMERAGHWEAAEFLLDRLLALQNLLGFAIHGAEFGFNRHTAKEHRDFVRQKLGKNAAAERSGATADSQREPEPDNK